MIGHPSFYLTKSRRPLFLSPNLSSYLCLYLILSPPHGSLMEDHPSVRCVFVIGPRGHVVGPLRPPLPSLSYIRRREGFGSIDAVLHQSSPVRAMASEWIFSRLLAQTANQQKTCIVAGKEDLPAAVEEGPSTPTFSLSTHRPFTSACIVLTDA